MTMTGLIALTGTQWGTAQDLTFGILLGAFGAVVIMAMFWTRSGHERVHRLQELRRVMREEHERYRPEDLEGQELPPRTGEDLPR